jgi:hypothetical protein
MNGEEKKNSPNLNTIYEEFDLSDRIKALKGKHIKIKKIVKKDDGNYSIRESSLFSEKSMEIGQTLDPSSPEARHKETIPYLSSSNNILPSEMNLVRQFSAPSSDFQFKKPSELKPVSFGALDYSSAMSFKREPVMPLSTTYAPAGSQLTKDFNRDIPRQNSDIFFPG